MKILVVDDDDNKLRQICDFLAAEFSQATVEHERSYQGGLKTIVLNTPNLVLLDMSMPTFSVGGKEKGGRERRYAGQQILDELDRKDVVVPVIIITQFERFGEGKDAVTLAQLAAELESSFPQLYKATIYYQAADSRWKEQLRNVLNSFFPTNPRPEGA